MKIQNFCGPEWMPQHRKGRNIVTKFHVSLVKKYFLFDKITRIFNVFIKLL